MGTYGRFNDARRKIWIDLDNSPHVPFFAPIIDELRIRGYSIVLTARNAFQVYELANLFHFSYERIGRHYGKHTIFKIAGTCFRASQLVKFAMKERPDLAVTHGSRSQILAAAALRIPSLNILDYEFARPVAFFGPTWSMAPEVIPNESIPTDAVRILRYPGIKEDVYVPSFQPDASIQSDLNLHTSDVIAVVRPPATEAHYHRPQSDELFQGVMEFLKEAPNCKIILLPRNTKQATAVRDCWPDLFASGKAVIPDHAVDGLNLIWHSDLVISGGGTMNREAAALGVPVYSIFRGKIGAVDQFLADQGRLMLLQNLDDVRSRIALTHRDKCCAPKQRNRLTLMTIIGHIESIVHSTSPKQVGMANAGLS